MRLKNLLFILFLILILYQLMEIYVIYSIEPAYLEVSKLERTPNEVHLELRVYFPNPYFLRVNLYAFTAKIECPENKGITGQKYNITLLPRQTNIFTLTVPVKGDEIKDCKLSYTWIPDLSSLSPLNIHPLNFTRTTVFPNINFNQTFIWAGWNATEINLGDCATIRVYTYPPTLFEVKVVSDYLSLPPATITSYTGTGEGNFTFCPKEPSSFKLKGYYLVVVTSSKTWVQADSYPPRLKVSP